MGSWDIRKWRLIGKLCELSIKAPLVRRWKRDQAGRVRSEFGIGTRTCVKFGFSLHTNWGSWKICFWSMTGSKYGTSHFLWRIAFAPQNSGFCFWPGQASKKHLSNVSCIRNWQFLRRSPLHFSGCRAFTVITTAEVISAPFQLLAYVKKNASPGRSQGARPHPCQQKSWHFSRFIFRNKGTLKLQITISVVTLLLLRPCLEEYPGLHATPSFSRLAVLAILTIAQRCWFRTPTWRGRLDPSSIAYAIAARLPRKLAA